MQRTVRQGEGELRFGRFFLLPKPVEKIGNFKISHHACHRSAERILPEVKHLAGRGVDVDDVLLQIQHDHPFGQGGENRVAFTLLAGNVVDPVFQLLRHAAHAFGQFTNGPALRNRQPGIKLAGGDFRTGATESQHRSADRPEDDVTQTSGNQRGQKHGDDDIQPHLAEHPVNLMD